MGDTPLKEIFEGLQKTYRNAEDQLHQRFSGEEPKERAFSDFLETRYGGEPGKPGSGLSVEQLAHLNRIAVDLLRRQGGLGTSHGEEAGAKSLPRLYQLGLTIHTGEQLLNRKPFELLGDVNAALTLGADRLGHAVILGMRGEDLEQMGLLDKSRVAEFNDERVKLLDRARRLGVVVELNITSNLVISNLTIDLHAAAELTRRGIRVSVSTDDEMLLHTSVVEELHRFAQVRDIGMPGVVVAALEAFASRLGTWELRNAAKLKDDWRTTLEKITPEGARTQVTEAIIRRFLGDAVLEEARRQNRPPAEVLEEALNYIFEAPSPKSTVKPQKNAPVENKVLTELIEPSSGKQLGSSRLGYSRVDWTQAAQNAAKVLTPGALLSLTLDVMNEQELQEVLASFKAAGFKDVKATQQDGGTRLTGER
jgi:hypothetical protein